MSSLFPLRVSWLRVLDAVLITSDRSSFLPVLRSPAATRITFGSSLHFGLSKESVAARCCRPRRPFSLKPFPSSNGALPLRSLGWGSSSVPPLGQPSGVGSLTIILGRGFFISTFQSVSALRCSRIYL